MARTHAPRQVTIDRLKSKLADGDVSDPGGDNSVFCQLFYALGALFSSVTLVLRSYYKCLLHYM